MNVSIFINISNVFENLFVWYLITGIVSALIDLSSATRLPGKLRNFAALVLSLVDKNCVPVATNVMKGIAASCPRSPSLLKDQVVYIAFV